MDYLIKHELTRLKEEIENDTQYKNKDTSLRLKELVQSIRKFIVYCLNSDMNKDFGIVEAIYKSILNSYYEKISQVYINMKINATVDMKKEVIQYGLDFALKELILLTDSLMHINQNVKNMSFHIEELERLRVLQKNLVVTRSKYVGDLKDSFYRKGFVNSLSSRKPLVYFDKLTTLNNLQLKILQKLLKPVNTSHDYSGSTSLSGVIEINMRKDDIFHDIKNLMYMDKNFLCVRDKELSEVNTLKKYFDIEQFEYEIYKVKRAFGFTSMSNYDKTLLAYYDFLIKQ